MRSETHLSLERLRLYCAGEMPDFEEEALEDHLAECEECLSAVRRMDALLFTGFSAETHAASIKAEALAADPLAFALRRARETYLEYAQTIHEWLGGAGAMWGEATARLFGEPGMVPARGSAATPPLRVALVPGEFRAEILIRETVQDVEVSPGSPEPALALLFDPHENGIVRLAPIERIGTTGFAYFEAVPAGHYRLAIYSHL